MTDAAMKHSRENDHLRKLIHCYNDLYTELGGVLNMFGKVLASFLQSNQVLFGVGVVQRFAGGHIGTTAVHLQSSSRCNDDDSIRSQSTDTAFNIAELLHAHIGSETAFGQDISSIFFGIALFGTSKLESYPISKDG